LSSPFASPSKTIDQKIVEEKDKRIQELLQENANLKREMEEAQDVKSKVISKLIEDQNA
jgi:hypothetical protein